MGRICARCGLAHRSFSHNQWLKGNGKSKCKACVKNEIAEKEIHKAEKRNETGSNRDRQCIACKIVKHSFSQNQWLKGEGKSRCKACIQKEIKGREASKHEKERETSTLPNRPIVAESGSNRTRVRFACDQATKDSFSHNQWLKGEGKSKCKDCIDLEERKKKENPFKGFFNEGSVGYHLFQMDCGIRSFLCVEDLISCSRSGVAMLRELCGTYTVPQLLEAKPFALPTLKLRIALGTEVMMTVKSHLRGSETAKTPLPTFLGFPGTVASREALPRSRPKELFRRTAGNTYMAYMYHPDELKQVHSIIDRHLRRHGVERNFTDSTIPVLVSAYYTERDENNSRRKDVTGKIASFIKDNELVLSSPRKYARYWYNTLFGDPFPNSARKLEIVTRNESTGVTARHEFHDDSRVSMRLAAQPP